MIENIIQASAAAEAGEYKNLSQEQFSQLLHSAAALQRENGMICLPDAPAPSAKISHAMAAAAIYAYRNLPEIFDRTLKQFLKKLLEGAAFSGLKPGEALRSTLLMLSKAGVREFLDENRSAYPAFAESSLGHMAHYQALAEQNDDPDHLVKELVACWNGNDRPVFVYGTLMKGERANYMLDGSEFGGCFLLKDYAMYHLGSYPGIQPLEGETVYGELYFVNSAMIAQMDEYEVEGDLYRRVRVSLSKGECSFPAEVYVYNRDVSGCPKMSKAWNDHSDELN